MKQKKKIIICSILAVCMLVILPNVSATQINLKDDVRPTIINNNSQTKHKLLRLFVNTICIWRIIRGDFWLKLSGGGWDIFGPYYKYQIPFIKSMILYFRARFWYYMWYDAIAEKLGWNWEEQGY